MCPFKYHCIKRNFIISCKKVSFALKCGCYLFMISFTGNDLNKLGRYSRWPEIVTKNTSGLTRYIRLDQMYYWKGKKPKKKKRRVDLNSALNRLLEDINKENGQNLLSFSLFVCRPIGCVYLNDRMNGLLPRRWGGGGTWKLISRCFKLHRYYPPCSKCPLFATVFLSLFINHSILL